MKRNLYLLFLLSLLTFSAHGQQDSSSRKQPVPAASLSTSFEDAAADSALSFVRVERVHSPTYARTGEASLLLNGKSGNAYFTLSKLIPVSANERVAIQAYATYTRERPRQTMPLLVAGAAAVGASRPLPAAPCQALRLGTWQISDPAKRRSRTWERR